MSLLSKVSRRHANRSIHREKHIKTSAFPHVWCIILNFTRYFQVSYIKQNVFGGKVMSEKGGTFHRMKKAGVPAL